MTLPITPYRTFWETEKGLEVKGYFEAYGAVVKEREVTGDPTAVPKPEGEQMGGGRSSPSNVSDILLKYFEVKQWLDKATKRQASLINFIYVDGIDYVTQVKYIFSDGSESEWLPETHEAPLVPISEVKTQVRKTHNYDLNRFEAPELEEFIKHWRTTKVNLLKREHERAGRAFSSCIS